MTISVIRSALYSALVLALAACAAEEDLFLNFADNKCIGQPAKKHSPVDWKQAKVLGIAIRDGVYEPSYTRMNVGEPTILRIANHDSTPRYFIEDGFLSSVAMARVSVGGVEYVRPCISWVVIRAGKKAELRFVPMIAGVYFPASGLSWSFGYQQGAAGMIVVGG